MHIAATLSPGETSAPSGAERTTPPTSAPGTNGSGGLNWYSPRLWSTSGNDTPAASTSTTTPPSGASMCADPGSSTSTSFRLEGPPNSTICIARIGGILWAYDEIPPDDRARQVQAGRQGRDRDRRLVGPRGRVRAGAGRR